MMNDPYGQCAKNFLSVPVLFIDCSLVSSGDIFKHPPSLCEISKTLITILNWNEKQELSRPLLHKTLKLPYF